MAVDQSHSAASDAEIEAIRRDARLSRRTLLATAVVAVIAFILLVEVDALEGWYEFTRDYEHLELDELPLMLGAVGGWLMLNAFVSLRRQRRAVEALEREAKARRAAEDSAVRHLESRTFFFAAASHELRTPLNAIIGFSEVLQDQAYGEIKQPEYESAIGYIRDAGADLLSTLNHMLDAETVLTNDNYPVAETEIDIADAVSRIRNLMAATMNRPAAHIQFENKAAVAFIRFDPLRFSHLLKNLLSNALRYSPADSDVVIRLSRGANEDVLLSVIDQGGGMPKDKIDRALRPCAPGEVDIGGGMGFAIVRSICEAHHCVLSIKSSSRTGTAVTVRMSADRAAKAPPAPSAANHR